MHGHLALPIPVQARPWNLLAEVPAILEKTLEDLRKG